MKAAAAVNAPVGLKTRSRRPELRQPARWWFWPLVIYTTARIINVVMMLVASNAAVDTLAGGLDVTGYFVADAAPAPPGFLTTVTNWDGQWYWQIATNGYPNGLPRDASGGVIQNVFAFYPLFPMMSRALMAVTGAGFPVASTLLSFTCGAVSALLLFRLVSRRSDVLGGWIAVVCLSAFTCAPVFLMAYADALALVLVLSVIWCVVHGRYAIAAAVLLPLAFTRNVVAAFALFFLVLAIRQWRATRHDRAGVMPFVLLMSWAGLLTLAWPAVVAARTGEIGAYFASQRAWVTDLGRPAVVNFIDRFDDVLGGPLVMGLLALVFAAVVLQVVTLRQPDPTLRTWSAVYAAYILLATDWNPSGLRYYLLALPALWSLTVPGLSSPRSRIAGAAVLATVGLLSQWWWIRSVLTLTGDVTQVP